VGSAGTPPLWRGGTALWGGGTALWGGGTALWGGGPSGGSRAENPEATAGCLGILEQLLRSDGTCKQQEGRHLDATNGLSEAPPLPIPSHPPRSRLVPSMVAISISSCLAWDSIIIEMACRRATTTQLEQQAIPEVPGRREGVGSLTCREASTTIARPVVTFSYLESNREKGTAAVSRSCMESLNSSPRLFVGGTSKGAGG
jgi:hypothetical protein